MNRYPARNLFLIAVFFVAAAPVFWHRVEHHPSAISAAYENADLYQQVYPQYQHGFSRLRAGDLPLWNPKQLCGTPCLAQAAPGLFQPLNALFAALPVSQALAAHVFLCLTAMGVFFVLFARSLGAGLPAAWIGGVAYAFCGAAAAGVSRPAMANALVWTPLLLWGIREYTRGFTYTRAVLAGLIGGMLLLSAANPMVVATLCMALPYALLLTLWPPSTRPPSLLQRVECFLLMIGIAVAVSAVQWIPFAAWAIQLERPAETLWTMDVPGQAPSSWHDLLAHALATRPGSLPRLGYLGVATLPVIPLALLHRRRYHAVFFLCASGIFLTACCLRPVPFPFPFAREYFVFPAVFSLVTLVSLGYDCLLRPRRTDSRWIAWAPALIGLAGTAALFYVAAIEPRGRLLTALVVVAPAVVFRARWLSVAGGMLLALVLFVDLTAASRNVYRHPFENAPRCYQQYSKSLASAEEQALGARVVVSAPPTDFGLPANLGMIDPILHGADGALPMTVDQALWWRRLGSPEGAPPERGHGGSRISPDAQNPQLLNFMAVRMLLAAPDSPMYAGTWAGPAGPRLREVRTGDNVRVFLNEDALPRAYWVPAWMVAEGVATAADLLSGPEFDAKRVCVVDRDSEGYAGLLEQVGPPFENGATPPALPASEARCSIEETSGERVAVQVNAPQPGITVLADTYCAGWRARLDGIPAPILKTNGLFRGIATPAGLHEIVFEYRPASFLAGMGFSLAALVAIILGGFAVWVRR